MKKILIALCTLVSLSAFADNGRHGRHYGHYGHYGPPQYARNDGATILIPLIIGGIIGYEMRKEQTPAPQQPSYVPPAEPQRSVIINGVVYVEALQYVPDCNCYKKIFVPR